MVREGRNNAGMRGGESHKRVTLSGEIVGGIRASSEILEAKRWPARNQMVDTSSLGLYHGENSSRTAVDNQTVNVCHRRAGIKKEAECMEVVVQREQAEGLLEAESFCRGTAAEGPPPSLPS